MTAFDDLERQLLNSVGKRHALPAKPSARESGAKFVRTLARLPRLAPKRSAAFAVAVLAAVVALAVVPSLDGSRTGIAQAAVLTRAAAALDQPNTILYLQVQQYSAIGLGPCMPGGQSTLMCLPASSADTAISADPADDTLTYSFQEWLSPDGNQGHTIYNNGDETVSNTDTNQYSAYDPADNTLTTLTDMNYGSTPPSASSSPSLAAVFPTSSNFSNPSYYENLYQQAQSGEQNAHLVGQTTVGGKSVYELQFSGTDPKPPANPPPGDMCGYTLCTPSDSEILLYLDSQTFTPVRTVYLIRNTSDQPGVPPGTAVWDVANYAVQSLPDTPANETLLQMTPHPGATQVQQTDAQYIAELRASSRPGSRSQAATTGSTGSTGTSASGASGASGTTAASGTTGATGDTGTT